MEVDSEKERPWVYLIDCPMGRVLWGPLLRRGIVKDLACLDKVAKQTLSKTDRLRFYLAYSGKERLDYYDRVRLGKIERFFTSRN